MIRIALLGCVAFALSACAAQTTVTGAVERDVYGKPILADTSR